MNRDLFLQNENDILKQAEEILLKRLMRVGHVRDPGATIDYLKGHLAHRKNEVFGAIFADTRHQVIAIEDIFHGSIDGSEVHPRVVAQRALELNAAAVIFYHNHPSGNPQESAADRAVTSRLKSALALLDIRVLDHIIIGGTESVSMASKGLV
jgi:DNA repair protein RadC